MPSVVDEFPPDVPDLPELVTQQREDDLVWLTIARPEVMNCLSFPTLRRLRVLCEELREDLSIRCHPAHGGGRAGLLRGGGPEGAQDDARSSDVPDLRAQHPAHDGRRRGPAPADDRRHRRHGLRRRYRAASVLRPAGRRAATRKLGLTETSLAIIPGAGGTQRLPRLVGKSRAKDLILTARRVGADEAERIGLVNRVAPDCALRETALEVAGSIAANGPVAVRAAKAAIDGGLEQTQRDGLEHEARCYERTLSTEDRLEALAAFAEKRKPAFRGQ